MNASKPGGLVATDKLIVEPWSYGARAGSERVEHPLLSLCFQAGGMSLLEAGTQRIEARGAHVSLNASGDTERFTIGESGVHGLSVDIPHGWLARFGLDAAAVASCLCSQDPDLVLLGRRLYAEVLESDEWSPIVIDSLLIEMLALLARRSRRQRGAVPGWIQKVERVLREDAARAYSLQDLGNLTGYHPAHVAREFRKWTGKTVGDYTRAVRLTKARELMSNPRLTLAEIAQEAGFADQSHLNRVFRRCLRMTPKQARGDWGG